MVKNGKHVLVMGANSFVGKHLIKELIDHGYVVSATYYDNENFKTAYENSLKALFEFVF